MIKVEHLTKYYGDFPAVRDLSFEIEEGHVYGFLGPNGAGKSTTMNIMTGCLSPTDGSVSIGGHDILEEPQAAKKLIGYLPEQPPLYMNETPLEYLKFVGEAKGLKKSKLKEQINEVLKLAGIEDVKERLISALSKGFRQRVGIAQALLGNPSVIILDEPTVGLDPLQIIEIRDLIRTLGETHTVILSSHILSEVQAICEKVLIINKGKLIAFDTPENLETLMTRSEGVFVEAEGSPEQVEEALRSGADIPEWEITDNNDGSVMVHIKTENTDTRELCRRLFYAFSAENLPIFEMTTKKATLEDVFIRLTEGGEADILEEAYAAAHMNEDAESAPAEETPDGEPDETPDGEPDESEVTNE